MQQQCAQQWFEAQAAARAWTARHKNMLRPAQAHTCRTITTRPLSNSGCGTARARRRTRGLLRGTASLRRPVPRSNEEDVREKGASRGRPRPRPSPIAPRTPERRTPHRIRHLHGEESPPAPAEPDTATRHGGASGVRGREQRPSGVPVLRVKRDGAHGFCRGDPWGSSSLTSAAIDFGPCRKGSRASENVELTRKDPFVTKLRRNILRFQFRNFCKWCPPSPP